MCPHLLLPCLWKALAFLKTPPASSGKAGAEAVFKAALPSVGNRKGVELLLAKACPGRCCHWLSC